MGGSEEANLGDFEQQASRCAGGRRELLNTWKAVRFGFERGSTQLGGEWRQETLEGL